MPQTLSQICSLKHYIGLVKILISLCSSFWTLLINLLKDKIPELYFQNFCLSIFQNRKKKQLEICLFKLKHPSICPKCMGFDVGLYVRPKIILPDSCKIVFSVWNSTLQCYYASQRHFTECQMVEQCNWIWCRETSLNGPSKLRVANGKIQTC